MSNYTQLAPGIDAIPAAGRDEATLLQLTPADQSANENLVATKLISADEAVDKVRGSIQKTLRSVLETAQLIVELSNRDDWKVIKRRLNEEKIMDGPMISRWQTIGRSEVLATEKNLHEVPLAFRTIYELATLGDAELRRRFENGNIKPDLRIDDVKGWKTRSKPKNKPVPSNKDVGQVSGNAEIESEANEVAETENSDRPPKRKVIPNSVNSTVVKTKKGNNEESALQSSQQVMLTLQPRTKMPEEELHKKIEPVIRALQKDFEVSSSIDSLTKNTARTQETTKND